MIVKFVVLLFILLIVGSILVQEIKGIEGDK